MRLRAPAFPVTKRVWSSTRRLETLASYTNPSPLTEPKRHQRMSSKCVRGSWHESLQHRPREPSEPHAKALARDLSAESRGIQLDRLEVIHVQPDELTGQPMKVDTKSLRLVPIGRRAPVSKSKKAN